MTTQNQTETFKFAKEAFVESILLKTPELEGPIDITALVETFDIYEDIFSSFVSASFTITDGLSLISKLPIIAQEAITVSFRSSFSEKLVTVQLMVYKVSSISENTNDMTQIYTLFACSAEMIRSKKEKVSRSFSSTHDEMVETIYNDLMRVEYKRGPKRLYIPEKCNDIETLIIPLYNPVRAISWISTRARNIQNIKECSFIFFERMGQGFVYATLGWLSEQESKFHYTRTISQFYTADGRKDSISPIFTIDQYSVDNDLDKMNSMVNGQYRSSLNTYDPTTRKYESRIFSSESEFDLTRHVEPANCSDTFDETVLSSPSCNIGFYPISEGRIEGEVDFTPDVYLSRNSQIAQFKSNCTKISVPGNSDLHAGDVVTLSVPSKEAPRDGKKSEDIYRSGRFLVKSIRHNVIRNQDYTSYIVLVRDSLPVPYPTTKKLDGAASNSNGSGTNSGFSAIFDT